MSGKWLWLCVGIGLLLAGCAPVEGGGGDPYSRRAQADADIQRTADARAQQELQATLQAAKAQEKTENEIAIIMAPVTAEAARLQLKQTEAALGAAKATQSAQETVQAYTDRARDLELAEKQVESQIVLDEKRRAEENRAAFDAVWRWAWPLILAAVALVACFLLYTQPPRIVSHQLSLSAGREEQRKQLERQKASVLVLVDGSKIWFDESGFPNMLQPGTREMNLPEGAVAGEWGDGTPLYVREVGSAVMVSKPRTADRSTTGRCTALVNAAIQKEGVNGHSIPRYDKIGYYSEEWQDLVGAMEAEGLLTVVRSSDGNGKPGTYLRDPDEEGGRYENLGQLRDALQSGRQFVRPLRKAPSPTRSLPIAGD